MKVHGQLQALATSVLGNKLLYPFKKMLYGHISEYGCFGYSTNLLHFLGIKLWFLCYAAHSLDSIIPTMLSWLPLKCSLCLTPNNEYTLGDFTYCFLIKSTGPFVPSHCSLHQMLTTCSTKYERSSGNIHIPHNKT